MWKEGPENIENCFSSLHEDWNRFSFYCDSHYWNIIINMYNFKINIP